MLPDMQLPKGVTVEVFRNLIFSVAFTNGIAEAVLAVLISMPVIVAIKKMRKN